MDFSIEAVTSSAAAANVHRRSGSRLLSSPTGHCPVCYNNCEARDTTDGKYSNCCFNLNVLLSSRRNKVDRSVQDGTTDALPTLPKRLINVSRLLGVVRSSLCTSCQAEARQYTIISHLCGDMVHYIDSSDIGIREIDWEVPVSYSEKSAKYLMQFHVNKRRNVKQMGKMSGCGLMYYV